MMRTGFVKQAPYRTRGFTLIELLVVISIIALLIAIILPALGTARRKAGAVACGMKMKGLGNATATYLSEFENTFPINGLLLPKMNVPQMYKVPTPNLRFTTAEVTNVQEWRLEYGALWTTMGGTSPSAPIGSLPFPQVSVAKAFLCPDDSTLARTGANSTSTPPLTMQAGPLGTSTIVTGPGSPGYWSYSVNAVLNSLGRFRDNFTSALPWADPIKTTSIQNPSTFIYFIEEDAASPFNDEVFDAPAFGGGDRITNRHNNGGNLGFGDGHVEWVSEVAFNQGGGNAAGSTPYQAMQSPWTSAFFPDGGAFATPP